MQPFHHRALVIATLAITAWQSAAVAGEGVMDILVCNLSAGSQAIYEAGSKLEPFSTKEANGSLTLPGPIQRGGVCIRNARLSAAFGVMSVMGTLCSDDPQPLLDLVRSLKPRLTKPAQPFPPGFLAGLSDDDYTLLIYQGAPTLPPQPDLKSKLVSFACAVKVTGAQ